MNSFEKDSEFKYRSLREVQLLQRGRGRTIERLLQNSDSPHWTQTTLQRIVHFYYCKCSNKISGVCFKELCVFWQCSCRVEGPIQSQLRACQQFPVWFDKDAFQNEDPTPLIRYLYVLSFYIHDVFRQKQWTSQISEHIEEENNWLIWSQNYETERCFVLFFFLDFDGECCTHRKEMKSLLLAKVTMRRESSFVPGGNKCFKIFVTRIPSWVLKLWKIKWGFCRGIVPKS